jgi:cytochrome c oxidase subunit 1
VPLSTRSTARAWAATCGVFGLGLTGFGTILGAVNFITTIISPCARPA